jgi:PilZ domain
MRERRTSTRQKSFLQGRIYFNNRRSSVDCLVRDVSGTGAKLVFSSAVSIPEFVELWLSNKEDVRRARVQWRRGDEVGVTFDQPGMPEATAVNTDLFGRVLKLESECASLKRTLNELRAEMRKFMRSEAV